MIYPHRVWPKEYKAFGFTKIINSPYELRPINRNSKEKIRKWRNAQTEFLRQNHLITKREQSRYFDKVVRKSFNAPFPEQILFDFFKDGKLVGYGGFVHISWTNSRAELSFLLDPCYAPSKEYELLFREFIALIKVIAQDYFRFHKLFTETYAGRELHIKVLESSGFSREGVLEHHVLKDGEFHDSILHGCILKK